MMRATIAAVTVILGLAGPAEAFGPKGHSMVGGIADQRLAGKPVSTKVSDLLDGLTLAEAALLPDNIKDWDTANPETDPDTFHLPTHPVIEADLIAFWKANKGTGMLPSHRNFHFTDVPVTGTSTYGSGTTGRSQFDVVHMVSFCVKVLKGTTPEDNDRKITKRIAVILLAHYVGDMHQPLHVGAQYFGSDSKPMNPDTSKGDSFGDVGGNNLMLVLERTVHGHHQTFKLHGFWDDQAAAAAIALAKKEIRASRMTPHGQITDADVDRFLAVGDPADWKLPASVAVEDWSTKWADGIMPLAREAHSRLEFQGITLNMAKKTASGQAVEKTPTDGVAYTDWAGKQIRLTIHQAGWRLAAILENSIP